jgi:phosphoglycolate phosphatase
MFDEVITFDDVERRKPDPDSLNKIMQKYDIQSNDALMIGDTVTDMRYAKAAGIDACAMLYGYGVTNEVLAENPQYALSSFLEF